MADGLSTTTYVVHKVNITVADGDISRPGNISFEISRPGNLQVNSRVEACYAAQNGASVNALTVLYPTLTSQALEMMGNTLIDGPNPANGFLLRLSAQLAAADPDFSAILQRGSVTISRPGNVG